jgi:hypothetical protein
MRFVCRERQRERERTQRVSQREKTARGMGGKDQLLVAVAASDGGVFELLTGSSETALESLAICGALGEDARTERGVSIAEARRG